eukprot:COSAG02_NODE_11190_length_1773_cov_23.835125_1_plen_107_part_00
MLLIPDDATLAWTFEDRNRNACRWGDRGCSPTSHGKDTDREGSPLNAAILSIVLQATAKLPEPKGIWSLDPGLLAELSEAYFAIADAYVSFLTTKIATLRRHQQYL